MTKDYFLQLLQESSKYSYDFAKRYVINKLPNDFKYSVKLNVSCDDLKLTQFDIYPEDHGKRIEIIDEKEVVDLLCRKDKVSVWIDISVECVHKNNTIFNLQCAGRYSNNNEEFYYNKGDTGPFGIKGPIFPIGYSEGQKFRLKNRYKKSLFSILKEYLKV